jgi:hypothetical protein
MAHGAWYYAWRRCAEAGCGLWYLHQQKQELNPPQDPYRGGSSFDYTHGAAGVTRKGLSKTDAAEQAGNAAKAAEEVPTGPTVEEAPRKAVYFDGVAGIDADALAMPAFDLGRVCSADSINAEAELAAQHVTQERLRRTEWRQRKRQRREDDTANAAFAAIEQAKTAAAAARRSAGAATACAACGRPWKWRRE